jgi:hypothetical protein
MPGERSTHTGHHRQREILGRDDASLDESVVVVLDTHAPLVQDVGRDEIVEKRTLEGGSDVVAASVVVAVAVASAAVDGAQTLLVAVQVSLEAFGPSSSLVVEGKAVAGRQGTWKEEGPGNSWMNGPHAV